MMSSGRRLAIASGEGSLDQKEGIGALGGFSRGSRSGLKEASLFPEAVSGSRVGICSAVWNITHTNDGVLANNI